jgi:hypothetical protein
MASLFFFSVVSFAMLSLCNLQASKGPCELIGPFLVSHALFIHQLGEMSAADGKPEHRG